MKQETKILNCKCQHKFQDSVYGPQKRLHNPCMPSKEGPQAYRCTVCSKEVMLSKSK